MLLSLYEFLSFFQPPAVSNSGAATGAASGAAGAAGTAAGGPPPGCDSMSLIMLLGMMAVFYFMLIRPESKRRKEREAMLGALKVGDKVRTNGGILGEITRLNETDAVIEVADRVRINVLRSSLGGLAISSTDGDAAAEKKS